MSAIAKATGAIRPVTWAGNNSLSVQAHTGDTLVVSQSLGDGSPTATLSRVDLSGTATPILPTAITQASHARVITTVRGTVTSLAGESQNPYLIWCDATVACNASNVSSYQLQAGTALSLAGSGTSSNWDDTRATQRSITQGLLSASTQTAGTWDSESLWLFDAAKAGSLSKVSAAAQ
jgi:hypothetical protein